MNRYDCEKTGDLLPALLREELLGFEEVAVRAHVAACPECADELRIVSLLQRSLVPVPAGLEARVLDAVRTRAPQRARWSPARLAMAATLAAALIGGSFALERVLGGDAEVDLAGELPEGATLTWAPVPRDPLLHGGSALQELSVEELEIVLAELDQ